MTNADGSVTVTRDSPWDDDEREMQHALDELVCPSCGNLRSVCSDPEVAWFPQRTVCNATAAREIVQRRLRMGHDAAGWGPHPTDGVGVWVSQYDLSPDDDFVPEVPKR